MFLFDEAVWEMELNSVDTRTETKVNQEDEFLFKDPKEYENLTPEERKAKTEKMLRHWKGKPLPGGAVR